MEPTSDDLQSLFADSNAEVGKTPVIVSFNNEISDSKEGSAKKRKRGGTTPKRPRQKKSKKFVADDTPALPEFEASIAPPPRKKSIFDDFLGPSELSEELAMEDAQRKDKEEKEKKNAQNRDTLKFFTFAQLKEEGRGENDIRSQIKRIDTMSPEDVAFEIQKISFNQSHNFTDKVATFLRDGLGFACDAGLKGEGMIQKEFQKDRELKQAVAKKLMNYLGSFGLNSQIVVLTGSNIIQGLRNKVNRFIEKDIVENGSSLHRPDISEPPASAPQP
jgi:hypothetical protein